MSRRFFFTLGLLVLWPVLWTGLARAHGAMPTVVRVSWEPAADASIRIRAGVQIAWPLVQGAVAGLESAQPSLEQVQVASEGIRRYMLASLYVRVAEQRCPGEAVLGPVTMSEAGYPVLAVTLSYSCPAEGLHILHSALFGHSPDHRVLVAVESAAGVTPYPLTARNPELTLDTHSEPPSVWRFLVDGLLHILSGADHILFVAGLLLITALNIRSLLVAVSGFTLAHTLTLVAAALGALRPDPAVVEPVIGFSIVLLGLEVLVLWGWRRYVEPLLGAVLLAVIGASALGYLAMPWAAAAGLLLLAGGYLRLVVNSTDRNSLGISLRYALMPFLCGLAHGLGFAGPLLDLHLPRGTFAAALVLFNAGVELGQLAIVATVLAAAALWSRVFSLSPEQSLRWRRLWAGLLTLVGLYWFVSRALGV